MAKKKIRFKIDSLSRDHQNVDIKTFKSMVIYRSVKNKKSEKDTANQINPNAVKETTPIEQPKMVADSFVVLNVTVDNPDYPIEIQLGKFLVEGAQGKIYSRDDQFTVYQTNRAGAVFVSGGSSYSYIKTYYMCEISGKVFELHLSNFMGLLYAAFSDDQELLEKINTQKYRFGDLRTIIDEYTKFKKQ